LFSLGLGARLGNGRWYMPWISLEDHIRALEFALSLIFGEFADAELTSSMRVIPAVLEQHGFEFEHHTIGEALAYANNSRPMK
ncbi:DUF1731 domain-containing protein, partial [Mycobacteroides abscessus]